jgi:glycosyltransferase involved in cell wall biosynthesis
VTIADCYVSVVAPLQDDADIVEAFVDETMAMLQHSFTNYELVLVDDGSRDDTVDRVLRLLARYDCMRLIRLSRRFGQEIAISAGLESVIGDYVVVMLPESDPPAEVPEMVARAREGAAIVFGIRRERSDEPWWLRQGANAFYWTANRIFGLTMPKNSTHFRVLSRQAVNAIIQVRDRMRYLRTLSGFVGYRNQAFEYDPVVRRAKPRRKSFWQALNLAISIVVSNTTRPLRLVSWLGLAVAGFNVLYMGYIVAIYLFKDQVAEGWVTQSMQTSLMFFFLAVILTTLAEYLGRLLGEVRERPLYYVMEEQTSSVLLADPGRRNVVEEPVATVAEKIEG